MVPGGPDRIDHSARRSSVSEIGGDAEGIFQFGAGSFDIFAGREQIAIRAPSAAKAKAQASPMPFEPPVTRTTLPPSPSSMA